uniref:Bax inhibitor 1 n=1 Tax=Oryctolagus cuniculus TaxID=9986 RepID=G1SG91_RABIT
MPALPSVCLWRLQGPTCMWSRISSSICLERACVGVYHCERKTILVVVLSDEKRVISACLADGLCFKHMAGLLSALGSLGLMMWLMATPHSHETEQKRLGLLAGFAFLTGVGLGPALELCIAINPSILPTAFLGTAMIFTCFTLSALYARRRTYLFLGGILMSAMSLMLLSSLGNLFFGSIWLFQANLYMGLVVMCGFVLFDTQLIIEKAENGDKDYIWHCVDLFLDFITLFRKLMMILAMNEKDKKKEKK